MAAQHVFARQLLLNDALVKLLRINECLVNFVVFRPEVNIKLRIVTEFNPMPVLRRNGCKFSGVNSDRQFRLRGVLISKAVIPDAAGHYAELTKHTLGGIVMAE